MTTQEIVRIIAEFKANNFDKGVEAVRNKMRLLRKNAQEAGMVFSQNNEQFSQQVKNFGRLHTTGGRLAARMRYLTAGTRGFRMELLGVMFFGAMVAQTMTALLKPASEALGIFELWSTTLMVLFLPIMEALMPLLISFMEFFMNLPEPIKIALGSTVLIVAAFAKLAYLLGSVGLGIGALTQLFPTLATKLGGATLATKLFAGAWIALKFATLIGGLMAVILWIKKLKDQSGSWGAFFENVMFGAMRVFAIFADFLPATFKPVIDWIADGFLSLLDIIKSALDAVKDVPLAGAIARKALESVEDARSSLVFSKNNAGTYFRNSVEDFIASRRANSSTGGVVTGREQELSDISNAQLAGIDNASIINGTIANRQPNVTISPTLNISGVVDPQEQRRLYNEFVRELESQQKRFGA